LGPQRTLLPNLDIGEALRNSMLSAFLSIWPSRPYSLIVSCMKASDWTPTDVTITPRRRIIVACLSGMTLLCAAAFLAACVVAWDGGKGLSLGGFLIIYAAFAFTLPIAIICTAVAFGLVGWRRCKLAWISFLSYALPFVIAIAAQLFAMMTETMPHH
jgi:hypothetical protein